MDLSGSLSEVTSATSVGVDQSSANGMCHSNAVNASQYYHVVNKGFPFIYVSGYFFEYKSN